MTARIRHQSSPTPFGCRWCGIDQREYMQRWKPPIGWHTWTAPTQEQIKTRMRERRTRTAEEPTP